MTEVNNTFQRFSAGISVASTGMGVDMPVFDPFLHTVFFDDFMKYTAGDWTVTETQGGATQALTTGHGGLLLLTNTGTEDDIISIQHGTTQFAFAAGRKAWMQARLQSNEATQTDILIGLSATDTSPIASDPADFVGFAKRDGSTAFALETAASSADLYTSGTLATFAADTFVTLGMYYDGASGLKLYANNTLISTVNQPFASTFPTAALRPTIAFQAGAASAYTCTIDYLLCAMER